MLDPFYQSPPDFGSLQRKLKELHRDNPFFRIFPIGHSLLARPIYAVSLGTADPCVVFAGAFHASEWLTCSLLIRYLEHVGKCLREKQPILPGKAPLNEFFQTRGLLVVPMVNPDGVEIALNGPDSAGAFAAEVRRIQARDSRPWSANARGVDLNHNYDAGFAELQQIERSSGITGPCTKQYGGAYAHSEPETQAMAELFKQRRVDRFYAFHSQGEVLYHEYGTHTPPQSRYIADLLCAASGYELIENDGLCSHGGCKDYFIEKYHRPGYTVEIGLGENPLPITDLDAIWEKTLELMYIATVI
jgi:g-D-glutamyl-meso-diaminopimelate peptidase